MCSLFTKVRKRDALCKYHIAFLFHHPSTFSSHLKHDLVFSFISCPSWLHSAWLWEWPHSLSKNPSPYWPCKATCRGSLYRAPHRTRMILNSVVGNQNTEVEGERKLLQDPRAISPGCKASVNRLAWSWFMSRTTLALATMKRSWEGMRLAGNTTEESEYGVIAILEGWTLGHGS